MNEQELAKLSAYFAQNDSVVLAFLFGSRAQGRERVQSDWDIAVYLKEENEATENAIWRDVEKLLGAEVDLVVLNRTPATLAWEIIRKGTPLAIKDRNVYLDQLLGTSDEAERFIEDMQEYYNIYQRSASLNEIDRLRLTRIITFLEEEIKDYAVFSTLSWKEYSENRSKKREVERWIEQLITAVVDIAKTIVASEHKETPATYRETVEVLGTIKPFDQTLTQDLALWTRVRNILAHEYLDLRWKNIDGFIHKTEPMLRELVEKTKLFMTE